MENPYVVIVSDRRLKQLRFLIESEVETEKSLKITALPVAGASAMPRKRK
jgi:hypothetical protein